MSKIEDSIAKYRGIYTGTQKLRLVKGTGPKKGEQYGDGIEFVKKAIPFIEYVIKHKRRAISLLDYGCGRAMHTHNRSYNMVDEFKDKTIFEHFRGMLQCYYCYDPAVPRYSIKPTSGSLFDMVVVADVFEHVPEEHVEHVLKDSLSFLKEDGLYIATISNNLSYSHFLNGDNTLGENLHCTLKPLEWWIDKFNTIFQDKTFLIIHNDIEYMRSINSKATLRMYVNNSSNFEVNKNDFKHFQWFNK